MVNVLDHHLPQNVLLPSKNWEFVQGHHIRFHGHRNTRRPDMVRRFGCECVCVFRTTAKWQARSFT